MVVGQGWSLSLQPGLGHDVQQIVLLDDLDMMIVFLADPLHLKHGDEPWKIEKANLNLIANFVASLPHE